MYIPLCCRAHYSGVLSYTKEMKITRKDGTVYSLNVPLFAVDYNGSIYVKSMKDTPYYSWADECDNESKDGLLKCDEIVLFLSHFSRRDVRTNVKGVVYYQEVNKNGVIVKNCSVLKEQDRPSGECTEQFVLEFGDEGNLKTAITYCTPGRKYEGSYTYNLATGMAKAVLDDSTVIISRPMKQKNYDSIRSVARKIMNQKETSWEFLPVFVILLLFGLTKLSKKMREMSQSRI